MELYQLQTFVIVAEEESITRAAKRLYTTPSTVSMHIKALEDELNVQLFTRTARGMAITEKGLLLKEKALSTLLAAQDFVNHATEMQSQLLGRVTIGLCASASLLKIPALVSTLSQTSPGIDLAFEHSSTSQIMRRIKSSDYDLGFVFGAVSQEFTTAQLDEIPLVIAAPVSMGETLDTGDIHQLAQLPWVDVGESCPFQMLLHALFSAHNLDYQRVVQSGDELTRRELVEAGIGASLLPREEAEAAAQQGKLTYSDTITRHCGLSLIHLPHTQTHPLVKAVKGCVLAVWS